MYADDTGESIYTDDTWLSSKSNVIFNDIWDGETCDSSMDSGAETMVNTVALNKDILIP